MRSPNHSNREILDYFVTTRLGQAPPQLKGWYGEPTLRKQLSEALEEDVARLDSQQLAELFAHHCPIPEATVSDYYTRRHQLPGLGLALIGIRFWSLDLNRPFVTVIAAEELPNDQQALAAAAKRLHDEYHVFKSRHIRLLLPSNHDLQPEGQGQFWEKRFLAAPLAELLDQPLPQNYELVTLQQATDTSSYRAYQSAFEELLLSSPQHHEYTRLESEEDLAELAQAGTLFDILVDGSWAGIVAVDRQNEEGFEGYRGRTATGR